MLFQLLDLETETLMNKENQGFMKVVMFLSFSFAHAQTRYQNTEREALPVVKNELPLRFHSKYYAKGDRFEDTLRLKIIIDKLKDI